MMSSDMSSELLQKHLCFRVDSKAEFLLRRGRKGREKEGKRKGKERKEKKKRKKRKISTNQGEP